MGVRLASNSKRHFLIKWRMRSHLFNSWEVEEEVRHYGGARKLDNFLRDPSREDEDVDVEEFKTVERVIDECYDGSTGKKYYLCKWTNLSYTECTWEPLDRIQGYQYLVEQYSSRQISGGIATCPKQLYRRANFRKFSEPPAYLTSCGQLRDYQLEGVNWLLYSWCQGTNVMLADEMGLGKTIQSISFISALVHEYGFTGPVLVVVPLSTIAAWQTEFARWAPLLNTLLYIQDARSRGIQRHYEWYSERGQAESGQSGKTTPLFHVLLTTYELVLKDREYLGQVDWRMLVVDEGHRLKNAGSQLHEVLDSISPISRLLVTGTPLQNSMVELWSLLHFLMPAKFPDYREFLQKYGPPGGEDGQQDGVQGEEAGKRLDKLHKILKPHLLRRMKRDVERSLPAKTERILRVELSKEQKHLSKLVITRNYKELACQTKNIGSLNNILIELKKVCNHPHLLGVATADSASVGSLEKIISSSAKMALLDELMLRLRRDGHRVLIFSQMVRMLDILEEYLRIRCWKFQRLDGSTSSEARKKSILAFNAAGSEDFCFLLSTRAGGLGINLETADTVIIYDSDWNPQNDLQAMARAHRIGQTRSVNIYRLLSKNSVEETILERAKKKMVLDHLVIQSMDTSAKMARSAGLCTADKKISKDELQAILKFGAQEIFKTEKEERLDLDEILARGENLEAGGGGGNSEFFDQFKVADFEAPVKAWDEIIPASELAVAKAQIAEDEERGREMVLQEALFTTASKRTKRPKSDGMASSRIRDPPSAAATTKRPSKSSKTMTDSETISMTKSATRALIAAIMCFGLGEAEGTGSGERFERVREALSEFEESTGAKATSQEDIVHALRVIRKKLEEGEESCKLSNNVHVNLSQLRERCALLETLRQRIVPHLDDLSQFQITEKSIKSVSSVGAHRWMIKWQTPLDDRSLLVGVYRHGFGRWVDICNDASLGLSRLSESLLEQRDDPKFLPKEAHLARRVENIISHMAAVGTEASKSPARHAAHAGRGGPQEEKPRASGEGGGGSDDGPEPFKEIKRHLKPVREQVAFVASLSAESFSSNLDRICEALHLIGNVISQTREADHCWKYITKFWPTEISGRELKHFYNRIAKQRRSTTPPGT